jgi:L-seryl-tRNA(Ser) seleniumtransferase
MDMGVKEVYNPYKKFGIRRVLNAASGLTRIGGSISHPDVFKSMEDASKSFVLIPELQQWAGKKIAEATGAEAGLPTAGASNSIILAAAACMMKGTELERFDPLDRETWTDIILRLPMHTEGLRTNFIVQKSNYCVYQHAVECAGGVFVEVGTDEEAAEEDLINAYDPEKTAAYYYTIQASSKPLPLETVIWIAHSHDIPVIVDAASEPPPHKNLKRHILKGADLVIISGGKFICGPNNSGILAGRKDLIKLAHLQAYPFHGIGRASKMSRETIVGLVKALELYLEQDEEALILEWAEKAEWIAEQLEDIVGIKTGVTYQVTMEENEPVVPLCYLEVDDKKTGISGRDISDELRNGNPRIMAPYEPSFLLESCKNKLIVNPEYMIDGDEKIVIRRLKEILTG